ncbi:HD domain-containing protein [Paenibacillus popilliae]|uniref:HD domain-containing protein n=1 Tax=Paenibacillus popilliae TaxID=78057 RepID=A0ABY3APC7_PAEPP|nr:HD domain-containing protein [Paenibacillus sp. SDF0028]TQR44348.1 HD domain-containing protein [Paenibacillus sp. SDF0028]
MNGKDVVHREITINDEDILALIETSVFQRLRRIKQQGNTHCLLSGATHNRYEHSIGVYAMMQKLIRELERSEYVLSDYERKLAAVCAVLHDIGHGPLSHCFKMITNMHHERWTARIIAEHGEIRGILLRTPKLLEDVLSVIQRTGRYRGIESLLFSQIGADKLDYHLRDLIHSGIGVHKFDVDHLLSGLRMHDNKLVVLPNAIPEIEQLIVIKQALFKHGFNHPKVIGQDVLLKLLFHRARYLYEWGGANAISIPQLFMPLFVQDSNWKVEDYVQLDDNLLVALVINWRRHPDTILADIATRYVDGQDNSVYWRVVDGAKWNGHDKNSFTDALYTMDAKYGTYRSGIEVMEHNTITDIIHLSERIRHLSRLPVSTLLYSISAVSMT